MLSNPARKLGANMQPQGNGRNLDLIAQPLLLGSDCDTFAEEMGDAYCGHLSAASTRKRYRQSASRRRDLKGVKEAYHLERDVDTRRG